MGISGFFAGLVTAIEVVVGLGFLIFVHELGHFLVAKWCGVKCEKFYLGFDIAGLKIWSFRWGETEYGIGILPLGGYVKMLGQDDNPARAAEERERSKLPADEPAPATADSDLRPLDPRSYMAQSIPKRMAIISAGVIMNLIAAVVLATVAYRLGVSEVACGIGGVAAGQPAYKAGLRPGDEIVRINDRDVNQAKLKFEDLLHAVVLGDLEAGVDLGVRRLDAPETINIHVKPQSIGENKQLLPTIGILREGPPALLLADPAALPFTAAGGAKLQAGDRIVAIDGEELTSWAEFQAKNIAAVDRPIKVTIERATGEQNKNREVAEIGVAPLRTLGLAMKLGPIKAVQPDSPAAAAGVLPGERIESIGGESPGDIVTLDARLRRRAGEPLDVVLATYPDEKSAPVRRTVSIAPRNPSWQETAWLAQSDRSIPSLGIALPVESEIASIEPAGSAARAPINAAEASPAAASALAPGDRIVRVQILPPKDKDQAGQESLRGAITMNLGGESDEFTWTYVESRLQTMLPTSQVQLTLADGRSATLAPANAEFASPERGFNFRSEVVKIKADGWSQAFSMGLVKTGDDATSIIRFIKAVFSRRVSPKNLGGLGTIATVAAWSASEGLTTMLLFLTLISANLAMINILPIPVLDGGHLMFLAWEAVRGKPPNEVWHERLTWLGLACVLFLIVYSNGLDVGRLFNWLFSG